MRYASRTYSGKSRGSARLKRSKSLLSEAREPELLIRRFSRQYEPSHQLADRRTVLEPVTRAAADQPGVLRPRMADDDEMLVLRLLYVAHARLPQLRVLQPGQAGI